MSHYPTVLWQKVVREAAHQPRELPKSMSNQTQVPITSLIVYLKISHPILTEISLPLPGRLHIVVAGPLARADAQPAEPGPGLQRPQRGAHAPLPRRRRRPPRRAPRRRRRRRRFGRRRQRGVLRDAPAAATPGTAATETFHPHFVLGVKVVKVPGLRESKLVVVVVVY